MKNKLNHLPRIQIRRMTRQDLGGVMEIERVSFLSPWSRGIFERELQIPFSRMWAAAIAVVETTGSEGLRKSIEEKVAALDSGKGVIILTDMFGGTPSNMSLAFLKEGEVEVLTGLNLPMLIKISSCREGRSLPELAKTVKEAGQRHINLASEVLRKKT